MEINLKLYYAMRKYVYLFLGLLALSSCSEEEAEIYSDSSLSYFTNGVSGKYYVQETGNSFDIEVGVTDVSSVNRSFVVTIDDASTATTDEYTIGNSLMIPAGSNIGVVSIVGDYNSIVNGSSLILNLTNVEGSEVASFDNSYTLNLFQYCDFIRDDFLGSWNADEDDGAFTYTSTFTAGVAENEIIMSYLWGADPSSTTTVFFDDSNPSNFVLDFPGYEDNYLYDNATYGAAYIDSGYGTFDACNQVIDMYFTVRVSAGTFAETHTVFTRN